MFLRRLNISSIRPRPSPLMTSRASHSPPAVPLNTHIFFSTATNNNKEDDDDDLRSRVLARLPPPLVSAWKQYGTIFIFNYFTVYFTSIGIFFFLYDTGAILPPDAVTNFDVATTELPSPTTPTTPTTPTILTETTESDATTQDAQNANVYMYILKRFGLESYAPDNIKPWMGNLAIAWLSSKIIEPLRAIFAVATTPMLSRVLKGKTKTTSG